MATWVIFRNILFGFTEYIAKIVPLSNWIGREDTGFFHGWTTFYWAWWIAWAPFIGTFIAHISKGRTVREFIIFVLLLPTLLCLINKIKWWQNGSVTILEGKIGFE
ncbi:hypothetical protein F4X88_02135 [Candidatus Poribacteria bacterium]|nr:hypothetical protein [Candidatus Poribacteria bacterium]MYA55070.1 hypothetical protein [Candidatus Poribacteria bacterium]